MTFEGKNCINGRWVKEKVTYDNINPSTGKSLGKFPLSTDESVRAAFLAAKKAFGPWKRKSRFERSDYLYKVAKAIEEKREELAKVISLETGKTYNESIAEVNEAFHMAQFAFGSGRYPHGEAVSSEIADKDAYMLRKPKGVVAIVSPFNFPLAIGAFWNAAPALVEGNTVIIKPSEDAPMSTQMAVEIYREAGIPQGVINLVHGDGEVGDMLINQDVDHICFTGSAEVGKHVRKVAANSWHKTTSCELGSKSAVVVFEDANVDLAMQACLASAFKLSGQRCVSAGRMIVHRNVMKNFAELFLEGLKKIKTGNPFKTVVHSTGMPEAVAWDETKVDEDVYYGPLINKQAFDKVEAYNQMVFDDAAAGKISLLKRGQRELTDLGSESYFLSPTVYISEWSDAPYLKNEVFGPHVAIIPFDNMEQAARIYNDTEYGLALGVVTEDFKKARYMRDECDAGMIYWNGGSIAAESHLAFGGVKKSGNGFPSAARTYRAVTHEISWTVNHAELLEFPQGMK
jgi:aldehyde dehydrogenase (NAD+)